MMSATLADLKSWISDMMAQRQISNYKLDISGNTTKGDGYIGEVTFLNVIAVLDNKMERTYHLIVKSARKNDNLRKVTPVKECFEREISMYTTVFPIFRDFQTEFALDSTPVTLAKCYSICSEDKEEALILENLNAAGFEIHDRKVPHNLNHALLVFRNYGKYHATSLALKQKRPGLFKTLTRNMTDVMGHFILQSQLVPAIVNDFNIGTNALRRIGKDSLAKKFDGFEKCIEEYLTNYTNPDHPHSVILHGDCWNNNMMFKYGFILPSLIMSATLADLESWISNMMGQRKISNYKLDISGNTTKGDGYLGEVTFLNVIAVLDNKMERTYHLIVKSAKKNDQFRKETPIKEAFGREIFMYTKVFPVLREFQAEFALDSTPVTLAKCYSICSEEKKEALILENLKAAGFEIHDRTVPQNLNHALLVFRNYGKYHATSLALKAKRPGLFKTLTRNMTDVMGHFISQSQLVPTIINDFNIGTNALKSMGKDSLAKKFDGFEKCIEEYLTNYTNPDHPHSVILHGDCWNNNMMFKYENGNKREPTDVCMIDFQLARVASPVFDLSYYLYSCADKELLDNFDVLLQAYQSSLSDSLKQFNFKSEDILTVKELKDQWKKYGRYGLSMAPLILKIELCESDEVVDFADGGLNSAFNFKLQQQDVYEQRLADVLGHFAEML